ncbi:MAG: amidase [Maricaulaceae bacterium]
MSLTRRHTFLGLSSGISALALGQFGGCSSSDRPSSSHDLIKLDGIAQVDLVKSGQLSSRDLVHAALDRIASIDPQINAFTDVKPELALSKADAVDISKPLAGLPYALKDLNSYPDMKFEMGTKMFEGRVGSKVTPYTEKIDQSGVVILGKTATPEFGLLGTTEPLAYKSCRNPWNLDHSAGGSSGGAAAAVAARMLPMAQASDGGGSIRNPAAQCGVYGLKPSRGRFADQGNPKREIPISIKHCVSMSVRDNALMLALTEAQNGSLSPIGVVAKANIKPKRIAMTLNDLSGFAPHKDVAAAVEDAARVLQNMGHEIIPVEKGPGLPQDLYQDFVVLWGESVVPIVAAAERASGGPARASGLLEGWTLDLAEKYAQIPDAEIAAAMARLKAAGEQLNSWLSGYDAWLTPSASRPAPPLGWTRGDLPFEQNLQRSTELVGHFALHNVAGTPGASIPWGVSGGLPIGVQLSGAIGAEKTLLELSYALEEARPWIDQLPPVVAA